MKTDRVDRAQFACAGAGGRFKFHQIKAKRSGNDMHSLVELFTRALGGAAGIVGELHGLPCLPRRPPVDEGLPDREPKIETSGLIFPRTNSRTARGIKPRMRKPWTRTISSVGSMRPRRVTTLWNASACLAICGVTRAAFALRGSMTSLTIGIFAGHASSHL